MEYNTCTFSNGLRVIHLSSASPVVYCGYQVGAGSRHEAPGYEGLAHFCEHTTFKGTARRSAWSILNSLEQVGGSLNAYTNKEDTCYYAAILKEHIGRAVSLLTDIVFHSTYPQAEIDKEVEVICDEIESYNDTPSELIYDEFENLLFSGHPLGHNILGESPHVRTFTTADALHFTSKHYRPDNAVFFAYGDISFAELTRMLRRAMTPNNKDAAISNLLPAGTSSALQAFCSSPTNPKMPEDSLQTKNNQQPQSHESTSASWGRIVTTDRSTHQAHVVVGCRSYDIHDPRRISLYLLNNILGGPGMNARLNVALRERQGLVYTVESSMVTYSDTGLWCTYFGCDHDDTQRCLQIVRRELNRFMKAPLTDSQLQAAKRQLVGQIGVACDSRENFALDFGRVYLHQSRKKDPQALCQHVQAVTADSVMQVARELFAPENLTVLIFGRQA